MVRIYDLWDGSLDKCKVLGLVPFCGIFEEIAVAKPLQDMFKEKLPPPPQKKKKYRCWSLTNINIFKAKKKKTILLMFYALVY